MASGATYESALGAAQDAGLAEPDPSADVDGHDSVAKAMILSGLVFGRGLELGDVERRGVSELTSEETSALAEGGCVREVTSLEFDGRGGSGAVTARVRPEVVALNDPLAGIDGTMNCVIARAEPLGEIRIAGPGAGPELAGQGVLSDLIRVSLDLVSREPTINGRGHSSVGRARVCIHDVAGSIPAGSISSGHAPSWILSLTRSQFVR